MLETAPGPRTTVQSPQRWSDDASWKLDFNNLAKLTPEDLAERRKEFDVVKAVIKTKHGRPVSKPFAGIRILDFTRYLAGPVRHLPARRCSAPTS